MFAKVLIVCLISAASASVVDYVINDAYDKVSVITSSTLTPISANLTVLGLNVEATAVATFYPSQIAVNLRNGTTTSLSTTIVGSDVNFSFQYDVNNNGITAVTSIVANAPLISSTGNATIDYSGTHITIFGSGSYPSGDESAYTLTSHSTVITYTSATITPAGDPLAAATATVWGVTLQSAIMQAIATKFDYLMTA